MIAQSTMEYVKTHNNPWRSLLWKELSESKMLVVWSAALMAALFIGDIVFVRANDSELGVDAGGAQGLVFIVWFISALLTSSSMVSPEIGGAKLQFLSSMPLPRKRVWWTKVSVALTIHLLSMIAAAVVFFLMTELAAKGGIIHLTQHMTLLRFLTAYWFVPVLSLGVFCVGTVVTMFTDRTLSSFFVSAILSIGLGAAFGALASTLNPGHYWLVWGLISLVSATLLAVSYQIFLHGESLRTSKRFAILLDIALFDLLPVIVAVILALLWITH